MISGNTVSLIIPCKNEAHSLGLVLSKIPKFIDEVIVIDNNSTDKTREIAKRQGATIIQEKKHIDGIGYGFAHQSGLRTASGDFLIAMDGDGSYPLSNTRNIINVMEKESLDFVSCSRFPLKSIAHMSLLRQLGSKILTGVFNFLFDKDLGDLLTGMWILRRSALPYLDLTPGDWNFSLSIKGSAALSPKIKFAQVHIPYHDRHLGRSKQALFKTGLSHLLFLIHWRLQTVAFVKPSLKFSFAS